MRPIVAFTVVAVVLAAASRHAPTARAQDAPPAPAAEPGPDAPLRRDPEAVQALQRISARVPSPGAAGFREMTCEAAPVGGPPIPVRISVRWPGDGSPDVSVVVPEGTLPPETENRIRGLLKFRVFPGFLVPATWDAPTAKDCAVTWERDGEARAVGITERSGNGALLTLGDDGMPTVFAARTRSGGGMTFRLAFGKRGEGLVLSGLDMDAQPGQSAHVAFAYFDGAGAYAAPRRVDWKLPGGKEESYVLFDLRLDGRLVEGTSRLEALAGHRRRVDDGARAILATFDAASASPTAAGVRTASCRVEYVLPSGRVVFRPQWTPDGACRCAPREPEDGPLPGAPDYAAGVRHGFELAHADLLRPASAEFAPFDVTTADPGPAGPAGLVLEPLDPGAQIARLRVSFDAAGLPTGIVQEFRDGSPPGRVTRVYESRGAGRVLVEEVAVHGEDRVTTATTYYDAEGFPPLRRTVTRTAVTPDGPKSFVLTYTDWVLDGRPVPGTSGETPSGSKK